GKATATQGVSAIVDFFGNMTVSRSDQTYDIINGQAKVKTARSGSDTINVDGSRSVNTYTEPNGTVRRSEDGVVTYTYGEKDSKGADGKVKKLKGVLVSASATAGVSIMDDGFGNVNINTSNQTYAIINGQAKVKTVSSGSEVFNLDGSHSVASFTDAGGTVKNAQDSVITYNYWGEKDADGKEIGMDSDGDGKLEFSDTNQRRSGRLGSAINTQAGVTILNDGFDNLSVSTSRQTFEIVNGQAKVSTVSSGNEVVNLDGSHSVGSYTGADGKVVQSQDSVVKYTYGKKFGKKGMLIKAENTQQGVTIVDDGFGNVSISKAKQEYKIIYGQAKVEKAITESEVQSMDGSHSIKEGSQASIVTYEYGIPTEQHPLRNKSTSS
ncbi:MAG: hypothetical protein HYY63_01500, partial [Elusimicrobia bacterium]|nr:hypothetical protein [Elusimicrobiota bacterium]